MTAIAGARRTPQIRALSGAAGLGLTAVLASPAWAHDTLISSSPAAGEVLTESPEEIVLEFSGGGLTEGDDIPNDIWVLDSEGENWESEEEAQVEGSTMTTELREELPDGEYTVLYHVVYSDGHDEELSFEFEVDAGEDAGQEGTAQEGAAQEGAGQEDAAQEAEQEDQAGSEQEAAEDAEAQGVEPASEENPAAQEQYPSWAPIAFAAAGVVVVVTVLLLVRQKMRQAENWQRNDDGGSDEGTKDDA